MSLCENVLKEIMIACKTNVAHLLLSRQKHQFERRRRRCHRHHKLDSMEEQYNTGFQFTQRSIFFSDAAAGAGGPYAIFLNQRKYGTFFVLLPPSIWGLRLQMTHMKSVRRTARG